MPSKTFAAKIIGAIFGAYSINKLCNQFDNSGNERESSTMATRAEEEPKFMEFTSLKDIDTSSRSESSFVNRDQTFTHDFDAQFGTSFNPLTSDANHGSFAQSNACQTTARPVSYNSPTEISATRSAKYQKRFLGLNISVTYGQNVNREKGKSKIPSDTQKEDRQVNSYVPNLDSQELSSLNGTVDY